MTPTHQSDMNSTSEDSAGGEAAYDAPSTTDQRYGQIELGEGDIVIFDRDETEAWLQSDRAVDLEA